MQIIFEGLLEGEVLECINGVLYKKWDVENEKYIILRNNGETRQSISIPIEKSFVKVLYGISPSNALLQNGNLIVAVPSERTVLLKETDKVGLMSGNIITDRIEKGVFKSDRISALYTVSEIGVKSLIDVFIPGEDVRINSVGENYVMKLLNFGLQDMVPKEESEILNYNKSTVSETEFIANGDFENCDTDTLSSDWSCGDTYTIENYEGNKAVKFEGSGNYTVYQKVLGLTGGEKYKISFMLDLQECLGSGAQIKLEFYNGNTPITSVVKQNYAQLTNGFESYSFDLIAPAGATNANVLIRLLGGGKAIFDNVSLIGKEA